ncbi:MAG: hypothetical protein ACYTEL_05935 [Planctomycetota bacterium]|jgi:hypothetical protein
MKTQKTIMILLVTATSIALQSGCSVPQTPLRFTGLSNYEQTYPKGPAATTFRESASQQPTAVESAIELSQKHARVSEEAAVLRQENQVLVAQNQHLEGKVATLDAKLQQAQKELAEANELLMEMVIELNNWKSDVIGFREEMRDAEKTQLHALLQILKALGGEVSQENAQAMGGPQNRETILPDIEQDVTLAPMAAAGPVQPQSSQMQTSGESNE